MDFRLTTTLVVMAALLTGCAGYTAGPILNNKQDAKADGVRYYEIAPFLLVYSDGKGNLTSQIVMMPDTSKKMTLDLYAIAANNDSTLNFENGVLTSSKFILDSSEVPQSLIATIQTLGTAAVSAAFNEPELGTTRRIPAPYLFKIVIDNDGTRLVGGQGVGPDGKPLVVRVSVTGEATSKKQATTASTQGDSK